MTRRTLPQRRYAETFDLEFQLQQGGTLHHVVTVGYFDDGQPAEVFVSTIKSGTDAEALARDGAILLSLAMQHHVPLETIASAITRTPQGQPMTIVGMLADRLREEAKR
jgi:hypothetical protein